MFNEDIWKYQLKLANKQFSTLKHDYKIEFDLIATLPCDIKHNLVPTWQVPTASIDLVGVYKVRRRITGLYILHNQ